MASGVGSKTLFGLIPAGTWFVPVQFSGTDLVKTKEFGPVNSQQEVMQDETQSGTFYPMQIDYGKESTELTFSGDLRYENAQWTHIIQLIGDDVGSGTSAPYTHTVLLDEKPTYYYTAAGMVDTLIVEWESVKPTSFEITPGDNGVMQFNCVGIASHTAFGADGTNTATTIGTTASFDSEENRVLLSHCRIRINAQAGAAVATGDELVGAKVSFRFSRPYEPEYLSRAAGHVIDTTHQWKTSEPQQNGQVNDIILTLELPELTALTYLEDFQDETAKKAEIYFIEDTSSTIKLEFPNLVPIQPDASVGGPGRIPQTIVYQALKPSGTGATGMAFTSPFKLTVQNSHSKEYHDNSAI